MQHILIVEDDLDIQDLLRNFLQEVGYEITIASDGMEAIALFSSAHFDLILLDIMLPKIDGFTVCELIRKQSQVPIIMLTALNGEEEQIRGLDLQVDDYITKPFKLNELLSRIKAILRRSLQFSKADTILEANGIRVDTAERLVWKNDELLDLPLVEYKLLCLFMQNPNHLMPREMILDKMWDGNGNFVDDNTLSVNVARLRKKLDDLGLGDLIVTKKGIGYGLMEVKDVE